MNVINVQHLSDVEFYLAVRKHALEAMDITYSHWENWKNSPYPELRSLSLIAKTSGLISYDRIMAVGE